jgi:uncharacterized membrane protein YjgN (DUF898 family)
MTFFVLFMRYEVVAFRYMWSNRVVGDASFQNDIAPGKIISVYLVGTLMVGICTILVSAALLFAAGIIGAFVIGIDQASELAAFDPARLESMTSAEAMQSLPATILTVVLVYLILFAVPFAYSQIFITRPILQRKAEAMVIHNAHALTQSRQRAHDHAAEAGGFADALGVDVGAGI